MATPVEPDKEIAPLPASETPPDPEPIPIWILLVFDVTSPLIAIPPAVYWRIYTGPLALTAPRVSPELSSFSKLTKPAVALAEKLATR